MVYKMKLLLLDHTHGTLVKNQKNSKIKKHMKQRSASFVISNMHYDG